MKINVAVSGKFHYHNYVHYLHEKDVLNRFYYAHRYSTNSRSLGVPEDKLVNIWWKEYLLHAHCKYFARFGSEAAKPYYREVWQKGCLSRWSSCDLLHIMLHGGGRDLIARASGEGAVIIGEPVNAHPVVQNEILESEYQRLGIQKASKLSLAQRRILEEADAVDYLLTASSFVKRSYVEKGYDAKKISVVPYAVNLQRFKREASVIDKDEPFRVICVAGISVRKGIYNLLEAWKQLGAPNSAELLLIGAMHAEMTNVMRQYQGLYKHLPVVPNDKLRFYLSKSSVFVLPTLEDGFSLVCGEAMACGLPIITTTNNGASEVIENGVEGFIVPVQSPQAIAERLSILMDDRQRAVEMGRLAEKKIRSSYSWEGYADKLIEIYGKLLNRDQSKNLPGIEKSS